VFFCSALPLRDKRDWEEKQNKRDGCALAQYKKLTRSSTEFLCVIMNSFTVLCKAVFLPLGIKTGKLLKA
jgi:hypothetical protein